MPRRARLTVPGVAHHVTQRGNNCQQVFYSSGQRRLYLDLLGWHATRCGVRILGYCLMPNHVHLIAIPEHENSLACALGRTHSEYALALNHAQGWSGHIWQNRFFSCLLDGSHLLRALRYVELNPVRAELTSAPWEWPWSSAHAHSEDQVLDPVLDCRWAEYLGAWNYGEWREILSAGMSGGECDTVRHATHTGEPLGSPEFVTTLEQQAGRRLRVLARGRPPKQAQAADPAGLQTSLFAG